MLQYLQLRFLVLIFLVPPSLVLPCVQRCATLMLWPAGLLLEKR